MNKDRYADIAWFDAIEAKAHKEIETYALITGSEWAQITDNATGVAPSLFRRLVAMFKSILKGKK